MKKIFIGTVTSSMLLLTTGCSMFQPKVKHIKVKPVKKVIITLHKGRDIEHLKEAICILTNKVKLLESKTEIKALKKSKIKTPQYGYITKNNINVREDTNLNANIKRIVTLCTKVKIDECLNNYNTQEWCKLSGEDSYIKKSALTLDTELKYFLINGIRIQGYATYYPSTICSVDGKVIKLKTLHKENEQ